MQRLFAFLLTITLASQTMAAGVMAFQDASVVVTGLSPGATVAWFGIELTPLGYEVRSDRSAAFTVADAGGSARYSSKNGLSRRSIWVAIELATGEYVVGKPAGSPATLKELDERSLTAPGRLRQQLARGQTARELFIVRPMTGAWMISVGDGGASDEDGAFDGGIDVSLDNFTPLQGSGPPPSRLKPLDVVVMIEPFTLDLTVGRVAR